MTVSPPPSEPRPRRELRLVRDVHAPVTLLDLRADTPSSGSRYLGSLRELRVHDGRVRIVLALSGRRFVYDATWESETGLLQWRGADSEGSVHIIPIGFERSRVEFVLLWRPRTVLGRLAATLQLDRWRVASELKRLAVVVESEAGDARLDGPLGHATFRDAA